MNLFNKTPSFVEVEISKIEELMSKTEPTLPEYKTLLDRRADLKASKERTSYRPSADAVFSVLGNVVLAALIMNYEKTDILTSKAMSLIKRQ